MGNYLWRSVALFAGLALASEGKSSEVVAVLSGDQVPYQQALLGVNEALGSNVDSVVYPAKPSMAGVKVVVSFGTQATMEDYPGAALIYAMVPDQSVKPGASKGRAARVDMLPLPALLAEKMLLLQGSLKNAAFLDVKGEYKDFIRQVESQLAFKGVAVTIERADNSGALLAALRSLPGKAQALWIPPSPSLMSLDTFNLIKDFCANQKIALYAPVCALAKLGAVAAIAPRFKNIGQAAGECASKYLASGVLPEQVYPRNSEMKLNSSAAEKVGLEFSDGAKKIANEVIP